MARRRSYRTPVVPSVRGSAPVLGLPLLLGLAQARAIVRAIEDRRRFHPLGLRRPAGSMLRSDRRLVEQAPPRKRGFSFAVPNRVAVCVRRKTRREVIFAKRLNGKGAGARHRRRSYYSDIGC